ncbi:MAG: di-heme oxidoredictase family protein [Pseudomonadota bacterium]
MIERATGLLALLFVASASASVSHDTGPLPHRADLTADDRERVLAVIQPADDFSAAEKFELRPAGAGTSMRKPGPNAFSHPMENLSFEAEQRAKVGNGVFKKLWVTAPASTAASDGLGPLYNARACQRCHLKDGRGHPPKRGERAVSMFLRVSVPGDAGDGAVVPEPTYGTQIQNFAIPGHAAEGQMTIAYEEFDVELNGGEVAHLRKPTYGIEDLGYGPLAPDAMISPRVANQMIGLGLLEAVHEGDILAKADPDDADGDGISGRPNWVIDEATGERVIGRFGWKAGNPSVRQQSAHAFAGDIGISSALIPYAQGDCTEKQPTCLAAASGIQDWQGPHEASAELFDLVVFYSETLAPPIRRNHEDPTVLAGKQLFYGLGCADCHTPKYVTQRTDKDDPMSFQLIWPYTDFLLHDMGEGLADNRPEWEATGREWRTPPLWGIGLTEEVNGHTYFLHDGRARSLLEAVLWHGGEAQAARDEVVALEPADRQALIAFLESL